MNTKTIKKEYVEFIKYFREFYGIGGLYPFKKQFTDKDILLALYGLEVINHDFCGDTCDRELVRDMILKSQGEK